MFEGDSRWRESADIDRVNHQLPPAQLPPSHQLLSLPETSGDDQDSIKAPKKRAETWVQDEIKALIAYRKEMDTLFNTSKSNKHLWEQISQKMKERGYDRSPTMCTDKWRNLLKEYKKAKVQDRGSSKIACYKDLEELLGDRAKSTPYRSPAKSDGTSLSPKGTSRVANLERRLDHDDHPGSLPSSTPPVFVPNGVPANSWCQRDGGANECPGVERRSPAGKVIGVKLGELTRRVRIDGPFESIKESIKTAFGLRTKRPFWLEDEEGVVQTLSRDMPPGQYSLILDPGITVKVCLYDDADRITGSTENKIIYTEEDFRDFLSRRGWSGLREVGGFRDIDSIEELRLGGVYQRAMINGA
ncbi:hypothetical protein KC19_3G141400 [Ceratodon purpureus]|uniref:Myb-like domain-containing protein n=1 Tax=Ceratodon purpureus TaxID=3225 RepID=A0A8T0IKM8_CERPU|nr:hypothetical protein KC19_3G141400 [Ceratodon purpureus]